MTATDAQRPTSPTGLLEAFAQRAASGDVAGLVDLYEPGAVFEPEPGTICRGHAEIEAALRAFVALEPEISYPGGLDVIEAGDVVLVASRWTMTGRAPDGTEIRQGGVSADVLRRQLDGTWLVLIDQPRGEPLSS